MHCFVVVVEIKLKKSILDVRHLMSSFVSLVLKVSKGDTLLPRSSGRAYVSTSLSFIVASACYFELCIKSTICLQKYVLSKQKNHLTHFPCE